MVTRLKHTLLHPFFLGCVLIYIGIRYLRSLDLELPGWINGQVTDLICMPVILITCLAGVHLVRRDTTLTIKPWLIFLVCVEYAILFEWILPKQSSIYTADWWDVLMYAAGGFGFYFLQPWLVSKQSATVPNN